jgi:hypothetical protein
MLGWRVTTWRAVKLREANLAPTLRKGARCSSMSCWLSRDRKDRCPRASRSRPRFRRVQLVPASARVSGFARIGRSFLNESAVGLNKPSQRVEDVPRAKSLTDVTESQLFDFAANRGWQDQIRTERVLPV